MNINWRAVVLIGMMFMTGCSRPLQRETEPVPLASESMAAPTGVSIGTPTLAPNPTAYDGRQTLQVTENETRSIRLYVPSTYNPAQPTALVINLHGFGSNANQQWALSGMSTQAEAEGFIVVYPEGREGQWFDGPGPEGDTDVRFIQLLIRYLKGSYAIDPKRVYVTGMSNGGGMTNRLACDAAESVATIGPVSGAYNFWSVCNPVRPVPVVAFHGLDDRVIPYDGLQPDLMAPPIPDWAAAWAERNGCDTAPVVTEENDDVTKQAWGNCEQGADVVLYTIAGHGHSWPGSELMPEITSQAINATEVMWEFFKAHPMP